MLIVFILLLTVISMALRLASMSINASRKIANRVAKIEGKDGSKSDLEKIVGKVGDGTARAASGMLRGAQVVVSWLRNILVSILPAILVVDIIVFLLLTVASAGFITLFTSIDENGNYSINTSGTTSKYLSSEEASDRTYASLSGNGKARVLLVGDSRTVEMSGQVLGMGVVDNSVIGETADGDYIYAKTGRGLAWMKENEEEIDAQVTKDTAVVINMGTNDAYSYKTTADQYVEWLNLKSADWIAKGASVWFMNTGLVDDNGTSGLRNSHVEAFNSAVKSGLNPNIGYIDEYKALQDYGNVHCDTFGVHYDFETYKFIWELVVDSVKGVDVSEGVKQLSYTDTSGKYTESSKTIEYNLYIPSNATTNMPLIVYLHGSGDLIGDVDLVKDRGMMKQIQDLYNSDYPFIGLQPCASSYGWSDKPLKELIDSVVETYSVDSSRIILTGHSMGAAGAWEYGSKYGDFFSVVVPVSWGWDGSTEEGISNLAKIPIKAYYGSEEASIGEYDMAASMSNTVKRIVSAGGSAKLILLEGYDHAETETLTYTKELISWMIAQ